MNLQHIFRKGHSFLFGSLHPESENYKEELETDSGYRHEESNFIRIIRILILTISVIRELFPMLLSLTDNQRACRSHPKCPDNIHCTPAMAEEAIE